jgi:aryl-alcohol dehydrogenase-like predicted oxidoreductase
MQTSETEPKSKITAMEYRQLGHSGLQVSVLSFGTGTFGGGENEMFRAIGGNDLAEATRIVDVCLEAGINLFDTADAYSDGLSEKVLGQALGSRRDQVLIATKGFFRMGPNPNQIGGSRHHLVNACEASLRRLGTDYIDLYQVHCFDALTPLEETLSTLDQLVRSGKVRYIGCSNYLGWQLMKALSISDRNGWAKYVSHQAFYSLVGRDYEWELMSLAIDQNIATIPWSPLGWGRLTGKIRRGQPLPEVSRLHKTRDVGPPIPDDHVYNIVDAIDSVAKETDKTVPQIALNWLLQRPTVASVIIGARNEEQLRQNLDASDWKLTPEQVDQLEQASQLPPSYPAWFHRRGGAERNPWPF